MNKLSVLLTLSLTFFGVIVVSSPSFAGITLSSPGNTVTATGKNMQNCTTNSMKYAVNSTLNRVERYANGIKNSANDIINTPDNVVTDISTSFKTLKRSTNNTTNNVIKPLNRAYSSLDNTLNGNIDTLLSMTEAMKNGKSFSGVVYDGQNKLSKTIDSSDIANSLNGVVSLIPSRSKISSSQSGINSKKLLTNQNALAGLTEANKSMKNIRHLEKIADMAGYDGFSVNGFIQDIDEFQSLNDFMNLQSAALPSELSDALNVMDIGSSVADFSINGIQQFQFMQKMLASVTSIAQLQNIQDSVFSTMEAINNVVEGVNTIQSIVGMLNGGYDVKKFENSVRKTAKTYKNIKANIGDIKKAATQFKKMESEVLNIGADFKNGVNQITGIFAGGNNYDIADLLDKVAQMPSMGPIVSGYEQYLDVAGKGSKLQKNLRGFGRNASDTTKVLTTAESLAKPVKAKLSTWGNDLKTWYNNDVNQAKTDIATSDKEVSKANKTFSNLKSKSASFDGKKQKVRSNIAYLKTKHAAGTNAYNKLVALDNSLNQLPTSAQIQRLATDGLGITQTTNTILNSYRKLSNTNINSITRPFEGFSDQMAELTDIKGYMGNYSSIMNTMQNSKQLQNALSGDIKKLGGFLRCFNIDIKGIVKDLLLRTQDQLLDEAKGKLWTSLGKATANVPFLMLPRDKKPSFENPFKGVMLEKTPTMRATQFFTVPKLASSDIQSLDLMAILRPKAVEKLHPLAGLQFAGITLPGRGGEPDFPGDDNDDDNDERGGYNSGTRNPSNPVPVNMTNYKGELNYRNTMKTWKYGVPKISVNLERISLDHGDFKATAWAPFRFQCGFKFKKSFCWYWKWHSCFFISHCYPVPYMFPACETQMDYKEPTVHVEISPRAATSQLGNFSYLKNIPKTLKQSSSGQKIVWSTGAESPVPSAHVFGISPIARYMSKLGPFKGNHTMVCDLAPKWDKFEYIQVYWVPLPTIKIAMKIGTALFELKDWHKEWFNEEAPLVGAFPSPLAALYVSELDRSHWNPRAYPSGMTPSGETYPDFEVSRTESYTYALPYIEYDSISATEVVDKSKVYMNKCDNGFPSDGSNLCLGDWGAILPRNGQVSTHNPRYPLKRFAQLAYRAYDKTLEGRKDMQGNLSRNIQPSKVADGTSIFGVGYQNTDFNLEWPYQTDKRYPVGTNPEEWQEGYFGKNITSGGMVMTYWRNTSCCVKACCKMPGFKPGSSYPWGGGSLLRRIIKLETEEWKITDVVQRGIPGENAFKQRLLTDPSLKKDIYKSCRSMKVSYRASNGKMKTRKKTKAECTAITKTSGTSYEEDFDIAKMEIAYNNCLAGSQSEEACMLNVYNIKSKTTCLKWKFSEAKCQQLFPEFTTMTSCIQAGYQYNACRTLGLNSSTLTFNSTGECLNNFAYATCSGYGFRFYNLSQCMGYYSDASICSSLGFNYSSMSSCLSAANTGATCRSLGFNYGTNKKQCIGAEGYTTCNGLGLGYADYASCVADGNLGTVCTGYGL